MLLRSTAESVGHSLARRASRTARIHFVPMRQFHIREQSFRHCRCGRQRNVTVGFVAGRAHRLRQDQRDWSAALNTILINAGADSSYAPDVASAHSPLQNHQLMSRFERRFFLRGACSLFGHHSQNFAPCRALDGALRRRPSHGRIKAAACRLIGRSEDQ